MRIAIGADHRGIEVYNYLVNWLQQRGHDAISMAVRTDGPCDYPDTAYLVATAVAEEDADLGILVCGSGIGMCIAANKVKGIRAALVHDEIAADISKRHNNANVLCLAADMLGQRIIERIVETWLDATFEGGRHSRRVDKIVAIEQGMAPENYNDAVDSSQNAD